MPEPQPQVSGSDILNYHGDAGLASGAGNGGILPQQGDPFAGISSALDQVNAHNAQMAVYRYHQRIKDQENLANTLSQTGGSVFNMKGANGQNMSFTPLPDDQSVLDEKAAELRKIILAKPDSYEFNRGYLDKKAEYDSLIKHAGVRSYAHSNFNTQGAQTNDPDERNEIQQQRDAEITGHKLTDYHLPEPHLPKLQSVDVINPKDWQDKKKLQVYGTEIKNIDGTDYEVKKLGIPAKVIMAPLTDVTTAGIANSKNALATWLQRPESRDPAYVNAMNAQIDKKAAEMGVQPVYAATVSPDGTVTYPLDPRQAMTAFNIQKYGGVQEDKAPSKAAAEQKNLASQIQHRKKEEQQKSAELGEKIKEFKAKMDLEYAKLNKKGKEDALESNSAVNNYLNIIKGKKGVPLSDIEAITIDVGGKQPATGIASSLYKELEKNGITDQSNYKISPLNAHGSDVINLAGLQAADDKGKLVGRNILPKYAYYAASPDSRKDDKFIIGYHANPKDKALTWETITPGQAIERMMRSTKKFNNITDKTLKNIGDAQSKLDDFFAQPATAQEAPPTQDEESDDEDAIQARLVPAQIKKKDGSLVDVMHDPVTNKNYAK